MSETLRTLKIQQNIERQRGSRLLKVEKQRLRYDKYFLSLRNVSCGEDTSNFQAWLLCIVMLGKRIPYATYILEEQSYRAHQTSLWRCWDGCRLHFLLSIAERCGFADDMLVSPSRVFEDISNTCQEQHRSSMPVLQSGQSYLLIITACFGVGNRIPCSIGRRLSA